MLRDELKRCGLDADQVLQKAREKKRGLFRQLLKASALVLFCAIVIGAGTARRLYLTWDMSQDYIDDATNVSFNVYSQTNVTLPVAEWALWTNISFAMWSNAQQKVEIPAATAAAQFYVVTASNLFGESDFSAVVSTRRVGPPQKLKIGTF